jgi:hypothetical protein
MNARSIQARSLHARNQKARSPVTFVFSLSALVLVAGSVAAQVPLIVPANQADPSIPHLTYNGRSTLCKAITRRTCERPYFRWDFDGDGQWDLCQGRTPAIANGNWYQDNRYNIDGAFSYTYVDPQVTPRKLYMAVLEVACSVSPSGVPTNPSFATYPVLIDATVPGPDEAETASEDALNVMRLVAMDDASWYLHKQMTRSGYDVATMSGCLDLSGNDFLATSPYALAMLLNGRRGAYPPETYNPYGYPIPAGFLEENDRRWNTDPYAEDVIRLINYIAGSLQSYAIPAADEEDDGHPPLPGTNDLVGLYDSYASLEYGGGGLDLAALAASTLQGTAVQVGPTTGRLFEVAVQQMVDFGVAAQIDIASGATHVGGWEFFPCIDGASSYTYSHMTGYWVLGLETAERCMGSSGVHVNQRVKSRLPNGIYNNQFTDGGPQYFTGYGRSLFETVGGAILASRWLGWDTWDAADPTPTGYPYLSITRGQARACYDRYLTYATNRWNGVGGSGPDDPARAIWKDGQPADIIACYQPDVWTLSGSLLRSGLRFGGPANEILSIGGHDWRREFAMSLVEDQHSAQGTCPPDRYNYDYFEEPPGYSFLSNLGVLASTPHAMLMAAVGNGPPIADLSASPCPTGACSGDCCIDTETTVVFSAISFDPDGRVTTATLDFGDGSDPVAIAPPGQTVEHRYASGGDFTATLTVTDDANVTRSDSLTMSVEAIQSDVPPIAGGPQSEGLLGAHPNPFRDGTTLWYRIARPERVRLEIFDAGGRRLDSVDLGEQPAGVHSVRWGGGAGRSGGVGPGQRLPIGATFARLTAGSRRWSQTLLRVH